MNPSYILTVVEHSLNEGSGHIVFTAAASPERPEYLVLTMDADLAAQFPVGTRITFSLESLKDEQH